MLLSIVVPTFNESANIEMHWKRTELTVKQIIQEGLFSDYEYIVIDNNSIDETREIVLRIAKDNKRVRLMVNRINYGPVISPFIGLYLSKGDYVVAIPADLQDPPELIAELSRTLVRTPGTDAVIAAKNYIESERQSYTFLRKLYYGILNIGHNKVEDGFHGFGIYSRYCIENMKKISFTDPSLRMLLPKTGLRYQVINYRQEKRNGGRSNYNIVNYSIEALRTVIRHTNLAKAFSAASAFSIAVASIMAILLLFCLRLITGTIIAPGFTALAIIQLAISVPILITLATILDRLDQQGKEKSIEDYNTMLVGPNHDQKI